MTTPEPAVSPAPDTKPDLRDLIADEIGRHLPDPVTGQEANQHEALYFGLVQLAEGREAGLRADLDQARRAAGEAVVRQNVLRSERDKAQQQVSRLTLAALDTCGGTPEQVAEQVTAAEAAIRKARDVRDSMAAESWAEMRAERDQARAEVERLTAERDAYRESYRQAQSNWRGAVAANVTALETIAELKRELAGARPIPDDAAERLRKLAVEFRSLSDQSVVDALSGEPVEDECDSPAECHGAAACWTWKLAARQVEKLAESLSTPTTGPAPAAADGTYSIPVTLPARTCVAGCAGCDGYQPIGHAGRCRAPQPAAPQAPAEVSSGAGHRVVVKLSTTDRLFWMADCRDCPDSYGGNSKEVADWAVEHSIATTPAERKDTAPLDDYGDNLTAGFLRPSAPTEEV